MIPDWIAAIATTAALLGSGTAAYVDLSNELTSTKANLHSINSEVEKLRVIVNVDREKIIKVEGDVRSLNDNLHELTIAVTSLDSTVKGMNNNLIRLLTKDEMRNE